MISWLEVVAVAPEMATLEVRTQQTILANVLKQCDPDAWGDKLDQAMMYLAAHYGTLAKRNGAGPITSESVGAMSRSYGVIMGTGSLALTAYGTEYERLARTLPSALGVVF